MVSNLTDLRVRLLVTPDAVYCLLVIPIGSISLNGTMGSLIGLRLIQLSYNRLGEIDDRGEVFAIVMFVELNRLVGF
jgi:hypothetical protein